MLQQTQLATVVPYYHNWLQKFPTITTLAQANLNDVLKAWEGLGYYSRARNIHRAAQQLVTDYDAQLPQTAAELQKLPGIGPYTAGAIASIAFNQPAPLLDGNVIRLFTRLADIPDDVTKSPTKKALWHLAATLVPPTRPGAYNQALMELGQTICQPAKPQCHLCPLANICRGRARGTALERPVKPPRRRIPHYHVAAGIIVRDDGRFLIAQRPLTGLLGGLWEFPGGKQEDGESLPQTLIREIEEELALKITVPNPQPLITIKHAYTHFRITLHAFWARYHTGTPQHIGVQNHAWVTPADLDQYPFAVTDQQIIAALPPHIPK